MSGQKIGRFLNNYFVLLVGVPLIVGIHWGWWKIQQNPELVDAQDRKKLPLFTVFQDLQAKWAGVPRPTDKTPGNGP
ncbi:hypothetical protein D910_06005 [Dendroctonus ponderosae]